MASSHYLTRDHRRCWQAFDRTLIFLDCEGLFASPALDDAGSARPTLTKTTDWIADTPGLCFAPPIARYSPRGACRECRIPSETSKSYGKVVVPDTSSMLPILARCKLATAAIAAELLVRLKPHDGRRRSNDNDLALRL